MKKAFGIISNLVSAIFIGPLAFYFSVLGLMMTTLITYSWSFLCIVQIVSNLSFLAAFPACVTGIIWSFVYRKHGEYNESYLIQLLPVVYIVNGSFFFITSMIWGNL